MATLEEMTRAGYKPAVKKSSTDQILGFLNGVDEQGLKQKEKEKADVMEQVKLYGELRKNGYSPEDAHAKVTRTYRSTSFIERLVAGDSNAFQKPTGEDAATLDNQKAKADIAKTESETKKNNANAGYLDRGGAKGLNYDKLTPNQIQTRIKYLRENELGMGERDDVEINDEITYLSDLFNKKSGFRQEPGAEGDAAAPPAKPLKKAAPEASVVMVGPDGKDWRIPKQNVARAKARGFKEKSIR